MVDDNYKIVDVETIKLPEDLKKYDIPLVCLHKNFTKLYKCT